MTDTRWTDRESQLWKVDTTHFLTHKPICSFSLTLPFTSYLALDKHYWLILRVHDDGVWRVVVYCECAEKRVARDGGGNGNWTVGWRALEPGHDERGVKMRRSQIACPHFASALLRLCHGTAPPSRRRWLLSNSPTSRRRWLLCNSPTSRRLAERDLRESKI